MNFVNMMNIDENQNTLQRVEKSGPGSTAPVLRPIILNRRSQKTSLSDRSFDQHNFQTGVYSNHGADCVHRHMIVAKENCVHMPSSKEHLLPASQQMWPEHVYQFPAARFHLPSAAPAFLHSDSLSVEDYHAQQPPYVLVPCGTTVDNGYPGELLFLKQQSHYFGGCNSCHNGKCETQTNRGQMPLGHTWKQLSSNEKECIQPYSQLPAQQNLINLGHVNGMHASLSAPQLCESGKGKDGIMNDSLPTITWLGHMDAHKAMPCASGQSMKNRQLQRCRPPYSYMALIQFAINSSPMRRMTLRQIYNWIEERFPYFKHAKPGWKNSIRHNLSLHDIFIREVLPTSKASYWTIRPDVNQRPLTLDCVMRAPYNHFGKVDELSQTSEGIQPCILLPVLSGPSADPTNSTSFTPTSSLVNSGLSPIPAKHVKKEQTGAAMSSFLYFNRNETPPERQIAEDKKNRPDSRKRRRKQPMKTLNDSLNDSLHFAESITASSLDSASSDFEFPEDLSKVPFIRTKHISKADGEISFERSASSSTILECNDQSTESNVKIEPQGQQQSLPLNTSDRESPLEDCIPQIFGCDTFAFNSSFTRFLTANSVSLFNSSGLSGLFSDGEEANSVNAPDV